MYFCSRIGVAGSCNERAAVKRELGENPGQTPLL